MAQAKFMGLKPIQHDPIEVRDDFMTYIFKDTNFEGFKQILFGDDYDKIVVDTTYVRAFTEMFEMLDADKDGLLSFKDLKTLDNEAWRTVGELLQLLMEDMEEDFQARNIDIDPDIDPIMGLQGTLMRWVCMTNCSCAGDAFCSLFLIRVSYWVNRLDAYS
ncbi:hypothetical protein DPMN_069830 [Dreissena polymorpha]|uniref:EF-hand domain-containing protein n=1 Tax=Dreissena polymorpha TaxID=45954 RepID=A0A9D3Z099_DREPO|nr:hypothetical protein DPMN_069830 [Dreissena polymorpha]